MPIREYLLTTTDQDLWRKYLPERRSVYGSLGNAMICESLLHQQARLHVIESEEGWIANPLQLRPLSQLPFQIETAARWDCASPEYTGPQVFGNDDRLAQIYPEASAALARREGVVAEFAHLHPWSGGEQLRADGSSFNREIIWCDSTVHPENFRRNHLEYRCRKSLNKAERHGLRIVEAESPEDIRQFARIYRETMARNNAEGRSLFPDEYFVAFRRWLPLNSRFTLTVYQDTVIGALFILFDDDDVYAYRGGSDIAFHHLNPATFQIWDAICWAHRTGRKRVILGGGFVPNDGIHHFKSSFSPLRQPFHIYKKVHRLEDYARLEDACRGFYELGDEPISYFPSYRYVRRVARIAAKSPTPVTCGEHVSHR
jgi:hypothetical protein